MLPEGWKRQKVEELGEVQAGRQRSPHFKDGNLTPYLRVANVFDGRIDTSDVNSMYFTEKEFERFELRPGDILLNEGQSAELVGRPAMYMGTPAHCCFQNTLIRFRPSAQVDPHYALKRFQLCLYDGTFTAIAKKTTSIAHLGVSRFAGLQLDWPPIPEQRRIAQILSTWDQAVIIAEQMLANSQRCTRDLMASMLSGRRRFPGFSDKWRYVDLDTVFERVTRKNATHNTNVLTISAEHGLISQRDYFSKSVASANLTGYTLLHRNDFAYNKSYSAGYPMGAIKPLLAYEAGVVSSLYLCFRLRDNVEADFDFFRHYFEAGLLNQEIEGIAQEGARNHGLLNVSVTDFFKLQLHIPCAVEQRRIAEVINVARAEEAKLKAQLQALRQEKSALMSQLLTGKRRVQLTEEDTPAQA